MKIKQRVQNCSILEIEVVVIEVEVTLKQQVILSSAYSEFGFHDGQHRSYRGDLSLMVLLPWRSDSGVLGLLLVTPDHQHTGGWHVKEEQRTHAQTNTKTDTQAEQMPLPEQNTPPTPVL